jgi:hypothetical protein
MIKNLQENKMLEDSFIKVLKALLNRKRTNAIPIHETIANSLLFRICNNASINQNNIVEDFYNLLPTYYLQTKFTTLGLPTNVVNSLHIF